MKMGFVLSVVTVSALLSGCATGNSLVLGTVGPIPAQTAVGNSSNGTLVVYSANKVNADFNMRDPNGHEYSDYVIFTTDGKILQRIHNNSGTFLQDPAQVELPPGKYRVVARANGYGHATVPVIIASQQTTVLHLEGDFHWPDESVFNQTNAVRLPDGNIVGWKSASSL
jgi:hypothetical protein